MVREESQDYSVFENRSGRRAKRKFVLGVNGYYTAAIIQVPPPHPNLLPRLKGT